MKERVYAVASVAFFPIMVAIDVWFFRTFVRTEYVPWYIANGGLISGLAAIFGIVWKDLNKRPELISANPKLFLSANLMLLGVQLQLFGHQLDVAGSRLRRNAARRATAGDVLDALAGLVATLVLIAALAIWFFAAVPLQYFIVLVAGAPARLARKMPPLSGELSPREFEFDLWLANFASSPVSTTNAVAGLLLIAIKWSR
jgi:hypothetical protein